MTTASAAVPNAPLPPNLRHFQAKPVDLVALAPIRERTKAAFARALDRRVGASDSVAFLGRVLFEAPGSAVTALELTKAATRTHDPNRFSRYARIAQRATASFPSLRKAWNTTTRGQVRGQPVVDSSVEAKPGPTPTRKLSELTRFEGLCPWLEAAFKEGRPPVEDVGEQETVSEECRLSPLQALSPDLQAATVVVRVGVTDQRTFGWVAVRVKGSFWLSPVVAESFAPALHPHGNGFSIELQRAEAYKAGLPELTAYITDRSTVLDVIFNEMVVTDRHRVVVMTFDGLTPETSESITLHSKTARSLIDPSEPRAPKGYKHSHDVGSTSEETYRLEWGDNQARLTPIGSGSMKPKLINLFTDA